MLLDDLTPLEDWTAGWHDGRDGPPRIDDDPVRAYWLRHPGLAATELRTGAGEAVVLAARLP